MNWNRDVYSMPLHKDMWLAMPSGEVLVGWRNSEETWFDNDTGHHNPIGTPVAFAEFVAPAHPDAGRIENERKELDVETATKGVDLFEALKSALEAAK